MDAEVRDTGGPSMPDTKNVGIPLPTEYRLK